MAGIFILAGMSMKIPAGGLRISLSEDGTPQASAEMHVRLDLWPTWLEVGCRSAEDARSGNAGLSPDADSETKAVAVTKELHAGLVALTSFAFALDGFYDTIRAEMGHHPDEAKWRTNRTARHAQVAETLRYLLKLGPQFTALLRKAIEELYRFRDRAVHPSSKYVEPNYRPDLGSSVHPHLITFSGPHAVHARALTLSMFDRLLERAEEIAGPEVDRGWLDRGRKELDRLSKIYRISGDDQPAFAPRTE
jgi:hypothetical protein